MLEGAPGNGKTSLAEAIAAETMVPFYSVRYEGIVSSFLGETASRLDHVFEFARTRRCLLFFDEFDTIAKERADTHETGEIKRVVSTLLLQIDRLPSHVIVVWQPTTENSLTALHGAGSKFAWPSMPNQSRSDSLPRDVAVAPRW